MKSKGNRSLAVAWWLVAVQAILIRYVKVDDEWIERVRKAASVGRIVFVLRNRSIIDLLCLRGLCKRHGLPEVSFEVGLPLFGFAPLWKWMFRLIRPRNWDSRRLELASALNRGSSAVVFLRRPAVVGALGSLPVKEDGIKLAVEAQASVEAPLLAMPTVFLWGEHAMHRLPGRIDFIFGSNEYPRLLRSIWLLLRRRSVHEMLVGEPLNLASIKKERGIDGAALAGVIRTGVGRQFEMIRRSKLGRLTKSSKRIKKEVLMSPRLMEELAQIASDSGMPEREIESKARSIVENLAADFRPRVLSMFGAIMAVVWKRLYTGIDVEPGDIERLKRAVAGGAALLLPTHKSHIDYLVLSQVMKDSNIMLPHIAAGQNLSFWPLGWLFRSSGAFFIRRRFMHDRFYTAVVRAYVRRLIQSGYVIEVFIEGGRSRTGKLLRPKLGMLEMALEGLAASSASVDLRVIPACIGYERVIEEKSYVEESEGSPKKSESIQGLLKTPRVLFSRYGRLYVSIGEPFSVGDVLEETGIGRGDLVDGSIRRRAAMEVAMRNLHDINRLVVATPSSVLATVLLTNRSRTIDHAELKQRTLWLTEFFKRMGAPISPMMQRLLARDGSDDRDLFDRTVKAFLRSGRMRIAEKGDAPRYEINQGQRLAMDYYKNNTIHFLVPSSLLCASCLTAGKEEVDFGRLKNEMELACRLYRWEFLLPDPSHLGEDRFKKEVGSLASGTADLLVGEGILARKDGLLSVVDRQRAVSISDVLVNFHEIYLAALMANRERAENRGSQVSFKKVRGIAERLYEQGRFRRPEGWSQMNAQNAFQALKEMKLNRPSEGERPFEAGGTGAELIDYLERVTGIEP